MLANRPQLVRSLDPGIVWPSSGTGSLTVIGDIFGDRPFAAHAPDIDFHRGIDVLDGLDPTAIYSPINGYVIRKNYTMFDWEKPEQLDQSTVVNGSIASFALTGSPAYLRMTGVNAGTVSFPGGIGRLRTNQVFHVGDGTENWILQLKFNTLPPSPSGKPVFGIYQASTDNYAAIWYDGTNYVAKGKDAGGVFGVDGTTVAPAGRLWIRVEYVASSTSVLFRVSSDGLSWTTFATEASISWSNANLEFEAWCGFDPAASGSNDTVDIANWEWFDVESIGRFGNWLEIGGLGVKWITLHHSHITVQIGAYLRAGVGVIAYTGKTGFDNTSGRIIQRHLHAEYVPNNNYIYANADPLNPLGPNLLPRCSTIDVSVTRSEANDPDGNASHKLAITVQRSPCSRFDINEFSLTGNTATRTLNWNTRGGMNPANNDARYYDGIYREPQDFDEDSTQYSENVYFRKSVVGATFVSAFLKDVAGVTLWSE